MNSQSKKLFKGRRCEASFRLLPLLILPTALALFACQPGSQDAGIPAGAAVGGSAWSAEELSSANKNCSTTAVEVNPSMPKSDAILMCGCIVEEAASRWSFSDFIANEFSKTETLFKEGVFDSCRSRVSAQNVKNSSPWSSSQILSARNNCVLAARDVNTNISFAQASSACSCVLKTAEERWPFDEFTRNESDLTKIMADDGTIGKCLASTLQSSPATALSKYSGSWRSECVPLSNSTFNSASGMVTLTFSGTTFTKEIRLHHLQDCSLLMYKTTETFTARHAGVDSGNDADEVNLTRTSATHRYFSGVAAVIANLDSEFGYKDWDIGVEHDVLNRAQTVGGVPKFLRDEIIFDLVRISGPRLYLGRVTTSLDRSTDAKRPDSLQYQVPFNYLWDTNIGPTITSPNSTYTVTAGTSFTHHIVANDRDGDDLTYQCTVNCPPGMSVSSSGVISWPRAIVGKYDGMKFVVSDGIASVEATLNVNVTTLSNLSIATPSPGSSLTPAVQFNLAEASVVTLFSDSLCSSAISGGISLPTGSNTLVASQVPANTTTTIYIKTNDSQPNSSACTLVGQYTNDSLPPMLTNLTINTPSPGLAQTTSIGFTLSEASTVTLYSNSTCSVPISASTAKAVGAQTNLTDTLPANSTTTIFIRAIDSLQNASPCSSVGSYTHDSAGPIVSNAAITSASPSKSLTANIGFSLNEPATVTLYGNIDCSTAISASVFKQSSAQSLTTNQLASNSLTYVYLRAVDLLGNQSSCISLGAYTNDITAPTLSSASVTSTSPSSTRWAVVSFSLSEAATVRLYSDSACSGAISGQSSKSSGVSLMNTDSLTENSTTAIYGNAIDAAGNQSSCVGIGNYTNDNIVPSISSAAITTQSPGRSRNPAITFNLSEPAVVTLFSNGDCSAQISPATSKSSGTTTMNTNTLVANTATTIFAKAVDISSNSSACILAGSYVNDLISPTISAASIVTTSPSTSLTPAIAFTLSEAALVTLYSDTCTTAISAEEAVESGSNTMNTGALRPDSTTSIYAKAIDVATNASVCLQIGTYTHTPWAVIAATDAPSGSVNHTAVWTGSKMIVWGGTTSTNTFVNTGKTFDLANNLWAAITSVGSPTARTEHKAIWTGSKMFIWGGVGLNSGIDYGRPKNGGLYDPAADSWVSTSTVNCPTGRNGHSVVWTGSRIIVWGGWYNGVLNDGGIFDPETNTWSSISSVGAPDPRYHHTAVWTGTKMIVWGGGQPDGTLFDDGGVYDLATDSWESISSPDSPSARLLHNAVWTGSKMIVWGGYTGGGTDSGGGGIFDPTDKSWRLISTVNAPSGRRWFSAIWSGSKMIVWGGYGAAYLNSGGQYDPSSDTWEATSTTAPPQGRQYHTAVWTGEKMIIWGGGSINGYTAGGHIYTPIP